MTENTEKLLKRYRTRPDDNRAVRGLIQELRDRLFAGWAVEDLRSAVDCAEALVQDRSLEEWIE